QVGAAAVLFPGPIPQEEQVPPAPRAERLPADADGGGFRLGLSVVEPGEALAERLGLPADEILVVSEVEGGTPAARAGVRARDVIAKIDGKTPATFERL